MRITPARAGKTSAARGIGTAREDHPRACGENPRPRPRRCSSSGSPPRVRGKTSPWTIGFGAEQDHPRACGENARNSTFTVSHRGSPPRVRGKLLLWFAKLSLVRITPARAGKTRGSKRRTCRCRDHPRACGENKWFAEVNVRGVGSPPRVRGKQGGRFAIGGRLGITPARAGKTARRSCCPAGGTDHPRACGENACLTHDCIIAYGSPPRVRGKH